MPLNPMAGGFDPNAGSFVPGQSFTPAPAPAETPVPAPAPAPVPAAEAKEETWESAPNVEAKEEAAAPAGAPAEEMEKLDVNDEELKKELAKMKAEGLLDEEEEAEITTGKVSIFCCDDTRVHLFFRDAAVARGWSCVFSCLQCLDHVLEIFVHALGNYCARFRC